MSDEKDAKGPRAPIAKRTVDYIDKYTHFDVNPIPKDAETQNRIADKLVTWSFMTDSFKIEEFAIGKRYNPYRLWKLRETNDYFAERLEFAKYVLALRLEEEIEDNKGKKDYTLALKKYPLYHREYKEYLDSRIAERKSADHQGEVVYKLIEIERYPSSPLVPEKKDERKGRDSTELHEGRAGDPSSDGMALPGQPVTDNEGASSVHEDV